MIQDVFFVDLLFLSQGPFSDLVAINGLCLCSRQFLFPDLVDAVHASTLMASCTPSINLSISSAVVYIPKLARTVASTPSAFIKGMAQWCPALTATWCLSRTCAIS